MKRIFPILLCSAAVLGTAGAKAVDTAPRADFHVVPLPSSVTVDEASAPFSLGRKVVIAVAPASPEVKREAEALAGELRRLWNLDITVEESATGKADIRMRLADTGTSPEAYTLKVTPSGIDIAGATPAALFRAAGTLRKSLPAGAEAPLLIPCGEVTDAPRFAYRGAHLDVSRHFFPADSVKRFIDMMALHNLNKFHWHITDDQGWRLPVESWPLLMEKGSVRPATVIGHNSGVYDSVPYGGHYTRDEIRDIVAYAADRHIDIIPEIDMPGHMQAALAAYPELGCTGGPYEVWGMWGVSDDVLCAGNDSVYKFIDDVLTEVISLFPSEYVHVGGDECPKVRWEQCPKCQQRIKELGLTADSTATAEQRLQSHVIRHATEFLASHGRKAIGWDETLEGGLAPGAVVMSWRGVDGAIEAARAGHDAILTPTSHFYFDYYQSEDRSTEPDAFGSYIPVSKVYSFEPIPEELTADEAKHILGVQANLWTEYIPVFSQVEYMELPRMAALSELQWSSAPKDWDGFLQRVTRLAGHYRTEGYRYAPHIFR